MKTLKMVATAFCLCAGTASVAQHQQHNEPDLHVNPKWRECSFQIDPALTQEAWREFTREAGLVAYFRPIADARPMGAGHFELSLVQWQTAFDDARPAWNDTFVHPDSTHWLKESSRLSFPGLTARAGITDKLDAGVFFTKNPGANYGFYGGQLQYNFLNNAEKGWSASARAGFNSIFGPEDLKMTVYGTDLIASREFHFPLSFAKHGLSVSPYVGLSTYLSTTKETTDLVNLDPEQAFGAQAMVGTTVNFSVVRLGVEYNVAKLSTVSFRLGVGI